MAAVFHPRSTRCAGYSGAGTVWHDHPVRDLTYPAVIRTALVLFKALGLRFQMTGTEHVPQQGGALLAFNHVSYVDFVLGGFAAHPSRRLVRFMAKREVFDHTIAGPVMRYMDRTGQSLQDRQGYINAVLGNRGETTGAVR